jgi:hypothetical protein
MRNNERSTLKKNSSKEIELKRNNKSLNPRKDQKEMNLVLREKSKVDIIKAKLHEKKNEINECREEIKRLFAKSNRKEAELKNYIAELNSKMLSSTVKYDERIDDTYKSIMLMIADIQEKVKMEINFTKKEMERDVVGKFTEAENRHQMLLNKKVEEQKKVFEKMANTKYEIEKIQKNFEETNAQSEGLAKQNEILKITLQSLEEDNENLMKKLKSIKSEYIQIGKEHRRVFKDEEFENPFNISLEESGIKEDEDNEKSRLSESLNKLSRDQEETNRKSFMHNSSDYEEKFPSPENVIAALKVNIKEVKNEYLTLHTNYIEEIKQRNEAQQLILKCIEDVKMDIAITSKDINNFSKLHFSSTGGKAKKFQDQLEAKHRHLESLENKIKILTFIYDNGLQNTKLKKKSLLSSSMSTFASTKYKK